MDWEKCSEPVKAKGFFIISSVALAFVIFIPLILLFIVGPEVHVGEDPTRDQWRSAGHLFFFGFVLPAGAVLVATLNRKWWKVTAELEIARWQGWLSTAILVITCSVVLYKMLYALIWASYTISEKDAFGNPVEHAACDVSLSARVSDIATGGGWLIAFALCFGIFNSIPKVRLALDEPTAEPEDERDEQEE